jgi:hypothetical protein
MRNPSRSFNVSAGVPLADSTQSRKTGEVRTRTRASGSRHQASDTRPFICLSRVRTGSLVSTVILKLGPRLEPAWTRSLPWRRLSRVRSIRFWERQNPRSHNSSKPIAPENPDDRLLKTFKPWRMDGHLRCELPVCLIRTPYMSLSSLFKLGAP